MKQGWHKKKLGEVCDFLNRGISPKYLESGGICVLNQKCVRNNKVQYELSRRHDLSSKTVSKERFIQLGDVLVNSTGTGTLGRVAQVRESPLEPTTVDSHVTIVRPKTQTFHSEFFGYMLIAIEEDIKNAGEGCGGQTELARSSLAEKFLVSFPDSMQEQKRIVDILDESFKAIDFAKANTEKNLQNAQDLFESYLNTIFTRDIFDWTSTTLEKILISQPRNGWSPPAVHHSDTGTPVLTLSSVTGFQFRSDKVKFTSAKTNSKSHYWVKNDDFLITRSNTPELVGHVAIAHEIEQPTIYPDLIMRMNPDPNRILTKFLYYQMRTSKLRKDVTSRAQGANPTMKKISKGAVQSLPIIFPSLSRQQEIIYMLDKLHLESSHLESIYKKKLQALDELKKSLLAEAFTGNL